MAGRFALWTRRHEVVHHINKNKDFFFLSWCQRSRNLLYPNQARQHGFLCPVNIHSCKSSLAIFNSLWRDDSFHLSVTGWWVFISEKTLSASFRHASHLFLLPGLWHACWSFCVVFVLHPWFTVCRTTPTEWWPTRGNHDTCLVPWGLPVIVWNAAPCGLVSQ